MLHRQRLLEMVRPPTPFDIDRDNLGPMVDAYIDCALWCNEISAWYAKEQIEDPALAQMIRDCVNFYWRNRQLLEMLYWDEDLTESQCGHDFWLSRNGHGVGFFDRGYEAHWELLQESARGFGPCDLEVTDKGTVGTIAIMHPPEYIW